MYTSRLIASETLVAWSYGDGDRRLQICTWFDYMILKSEYTLPLRRNLFIS